MMGALNMTATARRRGRGGGFRGRGGRRAGSSEGDDGRPAMAHGGGVPGGMGAPGYPGNVMPQVICPATQFLRGGGKGASARRERSHRVRATNCRRTWATRATWAATPRTWAACPA